MSSPRIQWRGRPPEGTWLSHYSPEVISEVVLERPILQRVAFTGSQDSQRSDLELELLKDFKKELQELLETVAPIRM